jgi:hypothetical protein
MTAGASMGLAVLKRGLRLTRRAMGRYCTRYASGSVHTTQHCSDAMACMH